MGRAISRVGTTNAFVLPVRVTPPAVVAPATLPPDTVVTVEVLSGLSYVDASATLAPATAAAATVDRTYLDVTYTLPEGSSGDLLLVGTDDLVLEGFGAAGVSALGTSPLALGGGTFRYFLSGTFRPVTCRAAAGRDARIANARAPPGGFSNLEQVMRFSVAGPTADAVRTVVVDGVERTVALAGASLGRTGSTASGTSRSGSAAATLRRRPRIDQRRRGRAARRRRQPHRPRAPVRVGATAPTAKTAYSQNRPRPGRRRHPAVVAGRFADITGGLLNARPRSLRRLRHGRATATPSANQVLDGPRGQRPQPWIDVDPGLRRHGAVDAPPSRRRAE
jgi:hypothetical protein